MTTGTRKRKSREVETLLRERIGSGRWRGSEAFPTERELAEELGVARNTLRTALLSLQEEGLISRHVGRGTVIKSQPTPDLIGIMQRFAGTSPRDIMNMRLIIEPQAAAAAAASASEADIASIREAHQMALASSAMEAFEKWDMEFHKRIFASTRNEFLNSLHDMLVVIRSRQPMVEIRRRNFSEERRQAYCAQHDAVFRALLLRNGAEASEAMRKHLLARSDNLFGT